MPDPFSTMMQQILGGAPPQPFNDWGGNRFPVDDMLAQQSLQSARSSVQGTWPIPNTSSFQDYPLLPMEVFSTLTSKDRELYMNGIRKLPDPNLSLLFGLPFDTRWTNEMINQYLQPYMDVHRTGMSQNGG